MVGNSNIEGNPEGQKVLKFPKLDNLFFNHLTLQTTDYRNIFIVTLLPTDNHKKEKINIFTHTL
ncbi:hypothetical protein RU87_GL001625 [Lactococcus plantarum]|mgnify:CR=1 FL=1|uniref:Uncharacterized protein n=1 Tax=Pseudolactococcus plantarum TaxID=1365 RepID=A0A2A5RYT8_9LACT|nr:hypothetical protein RU87_GL001625 [Lactococcus plantarum]